MDRWDPRIISTISVAAPAATAALLILSHDSIVMVTAAVLVLGVSVGAELQAATSLTVRYFGLRHFGLLFGIILSGMTVRPAWARCWRACLSTVAAPTTCCCGSRSRSASSLGA